MVLPVGAAALARRFDLPAPGSLMLFAVVIATAIGRLAAGSIASLVSTGLMSVYFIEPGGTILPRRPAAYAGVVIFLASSMITAELLSRARSARESAERARRRAVEARRSEEIARRRLDALSAASRALAVSFDVEENLARAADLGAQHLGDVAQVFVPDDRGRLETVTRTDRVPGGGAPGDTDARSDGDLPDGDEEPDEMLEVSGRSPVARAFRSGRVIAGPVFVEDDLRDEAGWPMADRRELALPLTIASRRLGVLSVVRSAGSDPFTDDDVAFAEELARRMARAIENSRLYRDRDEIADVLQQSLLPGSLPPIPGLRLAAHYEAAGEAYDVGGDFYDLIAIDGTSWLLVVGDVCGKGPEAAAVMGFSRASLRAAALQERSPSMILEVLNGALLSQGWGRYCTVACVRVDREEQGVRITSAAGGHPRPVVIRKEGDARTVGRFGTLLGVFPDVDLEDTTVRLRPGDAVALYTDGLEGVSSSAEDVVVHEGAGACGRPARTIVRHLERARKASPRAVQDDLALLVLSVPA